MKIYTFYENEIHSLEVRETKSRYIAKERDPTFGWAAHFDKNKFATSERGAIDLAINYRMNRRTKMKKSIVKIDHELDILELLLEKLS